MKRLISLVAALVICAAVAPLAEAGNGHFQGLVKGSGPSIGWGRHYTSDISLGWRFDQGNYLGAATGMHYVWHPQKTEAGPVVENGPMNMIPLYADYIHYFRLGKTHSSFFLGMEAGGTYEIGAPKCTKVWHHALRPYLSPKLGVDLGLGSKLGVSLGVNFIAVPQASDSEYMLNPSLAIRF
ncbi:MAG: hypothetical protein J6X89_08960 [Bacteroidales bacterium]|nr:hypothetical protein [Bacteroidales bacterium]